MSNLAIDIGNTRTKVAIFDNTEMVVRAVLENLTLKGIEEIAYNQKVENAILSSTAKVPGETEAYLRDNFRYVRLDNSTELPIALNYKTPETLGKDRIAAAVGASQLFPGENVLIVDAGTCIKMDLVTADGVFRGGNISPGVKMRLQAMHHFTEKLPLVEQRRSKIATSDWFGDSTETALQNGGELGALLEVTAFMEKCRRLFKPLKVVFTGGDADFLVKNIKTKIFANSNLVLIGLNKILQHNVNKLEQGKSVRE